jgi:hypothetical protein
MSKDRDRGDFRERLWRDRRPEPPEKVLPIHAPAEARLPEPLPPDAPESSPPYGGPYSAFEVLNRAERLHIVTGAGPSRFPSYHYLVDIIFDHHLQSAFTLIYTTLIVNVAGWNLWPVVHAISFGNCGIIREYHPKRYDAPTSRDAPLIEAIHFITADEKIAEHDDER